MRNVLVTGAIGFLGYHVVKLLNERGIKPRALVPINTEKHVEALNALKRHNVEIYEGDVGDISSLEAACRGCDTVLHLNFLIKFGSGAEVEEELERVNVTGTRMLLDVATKAGVERIVVSSSCLTIGLNRQPHPLDEQADREIYGSRIPYALSRLRAEEDARSRPGGAGLPTVVVVNPSFTMGPEDYVGAPANKIVQKMADGSFPLSFPVGFGVLDVRDYADGVLRAAEKGVHGRRYLLSGENVDSKLLMKKVTETRGVQMPRFVVPIFSWILLPIIVILNLWSRVRGKPPAVSRRILDLWGSNAWYKTDLAQKELGWTYRPLLRTIQDTLNTEP